MLSLIEMLRSTSGGIRRRSCSLASALRTGRLAVEHVLAQQVEGGLDAAGVQLLAGGDGGFGVVAGHEPAGQDERRRDHRRLGEGRGRGRADLRPPAGASYSARTTVEIPPRTWKSPFHRHPPRRRAATRSSRITLVTCS